MPPAPQPRAWPAHHQPVRHRRHRQSAIVQNQRDRGDPTAPRSHGRRIHHPRKRNFQSGGRARRAAVLAGSLSTSFMAIAAPQPKNSAHQRPKAPPITRWGPWSRLWLRSRLARTNRPANLPQLHTGSRLQGLCSPCSLSQHAIRRPPGCRHPVQRCVILRHRMLALIRMNASRHRKLARQQVQILVELNHIINIHAQKRVSSARAVCHCNSTHFAVYSIIHRTHILYINILVWQ